MKLSKTLRAEIERRGLSVTAVAEGSRVPFSTVSEFLRGIREIGADKASRIAEFLGFDITISKKRIKEMADYNALVEDLEQKGFAVDDESMELAAEFAENVRYLEENGHDGWGEDDAELASNFVADLRYLEENGHDGWGEDDAEAAASFRSDLQYLESVGEDAIEGRIEEVSEFVHNLKLLEQWGEDATDDRMQAVAEFVSNLRRKRGR